MRKYTSRVIYTVDDLYDRYAGEACSRPPLANLPIPKELGGTD